MSDFVNKASEATDQFLSSLAKGQDALLQAATAAAKQSAAFPIPAAPAVQLPVSNFLAEVPTAREVYEASFDFAQKLLAHQKAYAEKFIAVGESALAAHTSAA